MAPTVVYFLLAKVCIHHPNTQLFVETKLIKTQGESDKPYHGRETVQRGLKAEPQWTKVQQDRT